MLIFKEAWLWIKSVFLFLAEKENREIGIVYTKKALTVLELVASFTKSKKDDLAVDYMRFLLERTLYLSAFPDDVLKDTSKKITEFKKRGISDVKMDYDGGKIKLSIGPVDAKIPIKKIWSIMN